MKNEKIIVNEKDLKVRVTEEPIEDKKSINEELFEAGKEYNKILIENYIENYKEIYEEFRNSSIKKMAEKYNKSIKEMSQIISEARTHITGIEIRKKTNLKRKNKVIKQNSKQVEFLKILEKKDNRAIKTLLLYYLKRHSYNINSTSVDMGIPTTYLRFLMKKTKISGIKKSNSEIIHLKSEIKVLERQIKEYEMQNS